MENNANLWTSSDEFGDDHFIVEVKNENQILIRNKTNTKVLTVHNKPEHNGDLMEQNEDGKEDQLWIKEDSHIDGFFTLKNLKWDKYLTAVPTSSDKSLLQVQGKNTEETIHLRRWQIFTNFDPYPHTVGIPAK